MSINDVNNIYSIRGNDDQNDSVKIGSSSPMSIESVGAILTECMSALNVTENQGVCGYADANDDNSKLPDWFNDLVSDDLLDPTKYPGEGGLLAKLMRMLSFMAANPSNTAAAKVFSAFIANLLHSKLGQSPIIMQLLSALTGKGDRSNYKQMIELVIQIQYFINGCDKDKTAAYITLFRSLITGDDDISKDIRDECDSMLKGGLDDFIDTMKSQGITTYDEFIIHAQGIWGKIIDSLNVSDWQKKAIKAEMDAICNDPKYKDNALLLVMLILFLMGDANNADTFNGFAPTAQWLKNRTADSTDLVTKWMDGFKTEDDATKFMDGLEDLKTRITNSPLLDDATKKQMLSQINGITNMAIKTADGKTVTLEDLWKSGKKTDLWTALKGMHDPDSVTKALPPEYNLIHDAITGLNTAFSEQSATVSAKLDQISKTIMTLDNALHSFLDSFVTLIKAAIQGQKQ